MCVLMIEPTIPAESHMLDIPPWTTPVCAMSLMPLHWLSNCICLSWAFFPFTHSLCRVASQISIIRKQLSYLPLRTTQVFVYWFKINNLHSWVCSEHLSWLAALHLEPNQEVWWKIKETNINGSLTNWENIVSELKDFIDMKLNNQKLDCIIQMLP